MFYLAGIIITFFLALILLSKKGKTMADHVLAAWLCLIGFHLFLYYGQITGNIYNHTYLLGIQVPLPLLHGPLLYVYTLTATGDNGFSKKYWLHFIPALLAYIALVKFYRLPGEEKIVVYRNHGAGFEMYTGPIVVASIISGFVYVLLSFAELRKYKKRIADEFSNTERINLNWLRYLICGILAIWLVILLNGEDSLIFGTVVLFVILLGYFGIKHMGIFTYRREVVKEMPGTAAEGKGPQEEPAIPGREEQVPGIDRPSPDTGSVRSKYERSGLQKDAADRIHQELRRLMQKEKVFKHEELSLTQLARELGVHPNNLSQVINTYEDKNFYDYINSLRIDEFKELARLPENGRYTLLSLAFECGFNSKTSFNRNFKKITGESPSVYLKEMNVSLMNE